MLPAALSLMFLMTVGAQVYDPTYITRIQVGVLSEYSSFLR